MDINTGSITPPIDSNSIKIEPTSNTDNTTTPIESSATTTTSSTDSVNLSQTAINISRVETTTAPETENPQQDIDTITNAIQESPELAITAQSSQQLTSSIVQSLIG